MLLLLAGISIPLMGCVAFASTLLTQATDGRARILNPAKIERGRVFGFIVIVGQEAVRDYKFVGFLAQKSLLRFVAMFVWFWHQPILQFVPSQVTGTTFAPPPATTAPIPAVNVAFASVTVSLIPRQSAEAAGRFATVMVAV